MTFEFILRHFAKLHTVLADNYQNMQYG